MKNAPNTDTLSRMVNRRKMAKPCAPHKDANRYSRKFKHRKGWDS